MIRQRLFSFLVVISVGLLMVAMVMAGILYSWISARFGLVEMDIVYSILAFAGFTTLAFGLLYKILPDVDVAWRDVWIGAAVTALLVTVAGMLVILYLGSGRFGSAFEAAGSFAVLLIGIYYIAQIFLFGAVFTRVFAHMYGSLVEDETA